MVARAIQFGELVGAQVTALIEAELEASEESWRFIEQVGFERTEKGELRLKTVTFDMIRRDVDDELRTHRITIPVLTLVPLPLLAIEEATVDFDMQVEDVITTDAAKPADGDRPVKPGSTLSQQLLGRTTRSKLVARLARTPKAAGGSGGGAAPTGSAEADMKVTVKLAQSDLPLGIERLIQTADLGVRDES